MPNSAKPSTSRDVLDTIGFPLFLLQPTRAIVHANPAAQQVLEAGRGLYRERGLLVCRNTVSQHDLATALHDTHHGGLERMVIAVRRARGAPIPGILRRIRHSGRGPEKQTAGYSLFALLELAPRAPEVALLVTSFHLTPAEARVAALVGIGRSPAECAAALRIKVSTVRSQLATIFRKTGVASQAQLVRLVLPFTIF